MARFFASSDGKFSAINEATYNALMDEFTAGYQLVLYVNKDMLNIGLMAHKESGIDVGNLVDGFQMIDAQRAGPFWAELSQWTRTAINAAGRGSFIKASHPGEPIAIDIHEFAKTIDRIWLR